MLAVVDNRMKLDSDNGVELMSLKDRNSRSALRTHPETGPHVRLVRHWLN